MDMDTVKENVKKAVKLMPPELQLDFARLFVGVEKHMPTLSTVGPEIWDFMANDVMTVAMEFSMGTVDMDALSKAMHEAFGECGIVIPDMPKGG